MSNSGEVRSFDYVNHPYERVRDALRADAAEVFRSATRAAAHRAHALAAQLHVNLRGIEVSADIDIAIDGIRESDSPAAPSTHIALSWQAAERPHLFPLMRADLAVYGLTATETQLDFSGQYEPPLGPVGAVLDALAGRRIAEASVHRFVTDIASHLRQRLITP